VLLLGAGLGAWLYERHRTGSIYHPHARFVPQPVPKLPPKGPDRSAWPFYGYTKNHTRFFPASGSLHPPFTRRWVHTGNTLLEFPPVMFGARIFQLGDDGVLSAINKHTGHNFWSRSLGALSASSPAVVGQSVYVTLLSRGGGTAAGRVVALNYFNGQIDWSRDLPSPSESSPLFDHGKLFFGSQNGTVYALNAHNGNVIWTYPAQGSVKASPTLQNGVLYFGDYSGHVQAISEQNGHRIWIAGSGGALIGSGTFYSTAAVMYGRVFLGNTDGRIYAYDASSGKLDWAHQTGAYVYASPAVTTAPGLGATIYVGSYDGTFYALNARSGRTQWEFNAGGKISGSATIIGNVVYFADLGTHTTYGLGISTGKDVFKIQTGSFDPVITDGSTIFLTGYTGLYALVPKPQPAAPTQSHSSCRNCQSQKRAQAKSGRPLAATRKHGH
jgi:outer membrane protein assembly factor BamB